MPLSLNKNRFSKKIIAVLIVCVLLGGALGMLARPASAGGFAYIIKEFVIKPLVRQIANALENKLVNKINGVVTNINGKQPSFITNWRNHILDSQARGNDVFRTVLADAKLCKYFDRDIKVAFGADKFKGAISAAKVKDASGKVVYENKTTVPGLPSFQASAKCTLPSTFNVEEFRKDFRKGGWAAWAKLIEPQNNPYGVYAMAVAEQQRQIAIESQASENSSTAGQGFLSQKLGTGNSGIGPTGCATKQFDLESATGGESKTVSVPRCTFLGKEVTPAKILGETTANAIDKKLGRIGGATELTDILLSLFASVLNAATNKLTNFIGQNTYDRPPQPDSFDENNVPTEDTNVDAKQVCMDDCMKVAENTCTTEAKTLNCSASSSGGGTASSSSGGSSSSSECKEEKDEAKYGACISEKQAACEIDCGNYTSTPPPSSSGSEPGEENNP